MEMEAYLDVSLTWLVKQLSSRFAKIHFSYKFSFMNRKIANEVEKKAVRFSGGLKGHPSCFLP